VTGRHEPRAGEQEPARLGFWRTWVAVWWSFVGLRRGRDHARDSARLNPFYVVLAALLAAALFVVGLIFLARFATASL